MKPHSRRQLLRQLGLGACAAAAGIPLWASTSHAGWLSKLVADQVVDGLNSIRSYEGVTVETHLDGGVSLRQRVLYKKPNQLRVETLGPDAHRGELFVFDGKQLLMWWPQHLLGVRMRGLPQVGSVDVRRHVERLTQRSLDVYGFSLRGTQRVAGRRATTWKVVPLRKGPHRLNHVVWNDEKTSLPLRMSFTGHDNKPWYHMAFETIRFDIDVDDDAFAFAFPKNAVVFDWDLGVDGEALDDLKEVMNFDVKQPSWLPHGHKVQKVVRAQHCLPMLAMVMNRGASVLVLTQSRHLRTGEAPLGKTLRAGEHDVVLRMMGSFSTVTWVDGHTQLTLSGNLAFPDLLTVAAGVR